MSAWMRTSVSIWRRVAPAARSRATSRIRSAMVIETVLKMRNALAKSATAATSAVVAWKSAVDARRDAARSAGRLRTYGSFVSRASSALATPSAVAPAAMVRSISVRPVSPNTTCASAMPMTTVRPSAPTSGPSPGRIPVTVTVDAVGSPTPPSVIVEPRPSPSVSARCCEMSAPGGFVLPSPPEPAMSWIDGSTSGSMARTVTGGRIAGPTPIGVVMKVRRSIRGAATATPGVARIDVNVASDRPFSENAATRAPPGQRDRGRSGRRSARSRRWSPGRRTGRRPRARPRRS